MKRRSLVRAEPAPESRWLKGYECWSTGLQPWGKRSLGQSDCIFRINQMCAPSCVILLGGMREPVSVGAAIADDIDADGVFRRGGLAPVRRQRRRCHRHHFTSGNRLEVGTEQLRTLALALRLKSDVLAELGTAA